MQNRPSERSERSSFVPAKRSSFENIMKIGILGGTFNPVHFGHLLLAEGVRDNLSLDRVIFIPVNIPPHKDKADIIDSRERFKMLELAVSDNSYFSVWDIEIERKGISYSIDTLKVLKEKFRDGDELFFIVGSDEVKHLDAWKDISEIKKMVKFIVAVRPGYEMQHSSSLPLEIIRTSIKALDISGYEIRRRIREDKSIRYLLPDKVREFILEKRLYKKVMQI